MIKTKLISLLLLFVCVAANANGYKCVHSQKGVEHKLFMSISSDAYTVSTVLVDGVTYSSLSFESSTVTAKKGWSELPFVNTSIQISPDKSYSLRIIDSSYVDIVLDYPLLPSRGVLYRNENISEIPYYIADEAYVDEFYPSSVATAGEPFILRDVRGITTTFYPFHFNHVTNTLRVYTEIEVALIENQDIPKNVLKCSNSPVREMMDVYKSVFINYNSKEMELPFAQRGELLVITTPRDEDAAETYITWKKQMGFTVYKEVVEHGTNVKSLILDSYNNNNNILYVQLIGDWDDIKSDLAVDDSPTDPKLGCVVGDDAFPDLAIGRFSCSSPEELLVQLNKSIDYEKYPNADDFWRDVSCSVASNEGPGDDGEIDSVHVNRIFTQRLNPLLNYNDNHKNYGFSARAQNVEGQVNNGVSVITYCGHGTSTSWSTSGFSNSNILRLTNGERLPFIIAAACFNGAFNKANGDCFAEAWLKKADGGAVVTLMSSISQPWTPPMRGEDYFFDILSGGFDYDAYTGQNGINTHERRTVWGAIVLNTFSLMLSESHYTSDVETVYTWCTFGDVTLQLFTAKPQHINNSNNSIVAGQHFQTTITDDEGNPVENATVCISQPDGNFSEVTDSIGFVSIEHGLQPGKVVLTVSAFNMETISQEIDCITEDDYYIVFEDYSLSDSILVYYNPSQISIDLKNYGRATAHNVTVSISSDCPYLDFTVNEAVLDFVESDVLSSFENVFTVEVSEDAEDGYIADVIVTIECDGEIREYETQMMLHNVVPEFVAYGIDGDFIPGGNVSLKVSFTNNGGAPIINADGTLNVDSEYITIINNTTQVGDILPNDTVILDYELIVSESAPWDTDVPFTINLIGDYQFSYNADFAANINTCNIAVTDFPVIVDFESGIPECWAQEYISGADTALWKLYNGGLEGRPEEAHSGTNNLLIYSEDGATSKLIISRMNLENAVSAKLSFWYTQPRRGTSQQDVLNVYYKASACDSWTLLSSYSISISSWRKRNIDLPNLSSDYYVAFEAVCNGGYGISLDDILIDIVGVEGINGTEFAVNTKIYPNPTDKFLFVEGEYIGGIIVYDYKGQIIDRKEFDGLNEKIRLDVTNYKAGLYIIEVENKDGLRYRNKFLITK